MSIFTLADKIGICTSVICMIHCLAIPIFLIFGFESLLSLFDQEWLELSIICFALAIGLISFLGGFLKHRHHHVVVLFIAGFLLLINGESIEQTSGSVSLTLAGAFVIAYAHYQNLRLKTHVFAG